MENDDTVRYRVNLLKKLVDEAGGNADFARKYSQPYADKPIDETYVSQLLNGHRRFGEKAARAMERRGGLPAGYFEPPFNLTADAKRLANAFMTLDRNKQDEVLMWVLGEAAKQRLMGDAPLPPSESSDDPAPGPRTQPPRTGARPK